MAELRFWSALSLAASPDGIVADLRRQLRAGGGPLDLAVAFIRPSETELAEPIMRALRRDLGVAHFLACTSESVVGAGREVEGQVATSLLAARLPGVRIDPLPALAEGPPAFETPAQELAAVVALADPFSVRVNRLAELYNTAAPGVPLLGGVVSWASESGQNRLAQDDVVTNHGAVGFVLSGDLDVRVVVSQGCRAIGKPLTVTAAQGNVVTALDGASPLAVLRALYAESDDATQRLLRAGVLVGRSIVRDPGAVARGAFLIRSIIGADAESGAVAVGDRVEVGDVVQFHVRDGTTAREDLELLLTSQAFEAPAAGALLFTCNGRGSRMYGYPDGDVQILQRALGHDVPVAGFFCAGELGPIGGENFVHGFTASLGMFRSKR
ncbi:MAG: FIST C-terminal domain-containing protein [Actinobacteria bacterium]|nr:FIST C-terminal domain-containing protein [Actinomycetota bacterium]